MYQKPKSEQLHFDDFELSFGGCLDKTNRWITLAGIIPWDELEHLYSNNFCDNNGRKALPVRVALGALIIKAKLNITDRETVSQISENPYLQYFIGQTSFTIGEPFDSSLMVHFRKRLELSDITDINELIVKWNSPQIKNQNQNDDDPEGGGKNKGTLKVDASVAPADIPFPTDVTLLNECREKSEEIIDNICEVSGQKKPRTYRRIARKDFVGFIKKRTHSKKQIRKAIRKQLGYLRRNIKAIHTLLQGRSLHLIGSKRLIKLFYVLQEVYRQQREMYREKKNSVKDRIVNIYQPHVRPIVRGKAGARTEFGAKFSLSIADGVSFVDRVDWNNYNEGEDLIPQVEVYKKRYGHYPEAVYADQIYGSRKNRKYLKERNIRFAGKALGRPKQMTKEEKRMAKNDHGVRNEVEGKIGVGKRRYSMDEILMKLAGTSEMWIGMVVLVMNLEKFLQIIFCPVRILVKKLILKFKSLVCRSVWYFLQVEG